MSDKVEFVDYKDLPSSTVGKFLLSKGFDLASCLGDASDSFDPNSLGILRKDPDAKPISYLFGLKKREPRRVFLGTVWFSSSARGADERNWVFDVYCRKHVELVEQLAEEMASLFNVKISIHLVSDEPRVETYWSDFEM